MVPHYRFITAPTESFFLFGPRGTGKTTWLRQHLPHALVINLLDPETVREMTARPERLRDLVLGNPERLDVVVDEVQRVPELLQVVHALIESDRRVRFVLTGSSARKLRRGGVNLLGGRAAVRNMHPFMAAELPQFELLTALQFGMVPLITMARNPHETLAAYASLYLEQEVKAEGLVRHVGSFARFLETVSFSHGSVLTLTNVARDAAVNRKTVEGFVEVLEDLLVSFKVPVFTKRARRATAAHPKFYFFDAGVFRSLRPGGPLDQPTEIDGAALEGLVAQQLRAWIAYTPDEHELFYWRTRSGVEVDFVVYGAKQFAAVEVKNSDRVRPADLRGLRTFREDYPECQPILLYRGRDKLDVDGISCWPVEHFLRELRPASWPL
ncbi:MAG: ATP-binding protein [Phycisphaerae bacterium]|nr:ATP-binding protein [Gemmatimonadaceae bacterium]